MENRLILSVIGLMILLFVTIFSFDFVYVGGHQIGVKETWSGVDPNPLNPGYHLIPLTQKVTLYDMSTQIFTMGGPKKLEDENYLDPYLIQSKEGQNVYVSLNVQWQLEPSKIIYIHTKYINGVIKTLIHPVILNIVKNVVTKTPTMDVYSGEGLVKLQQDIQNKLAESNGELKVSGVNVLNFVISHIDLSKAYVEEINGKQLATQKTLRFKEEKLAADAQADVAKASAMADFNTKVVEAEKNAKVRVIAAQAENEAAIVAAKAEQQKRILEAEGLKQANVLQAEGNLALFQAEADGKGLLFDAWNNPGANAYVKIEVAKQVATAFGNVKGYLPGDMSVNLLTGSFMKSVDALTGNVVVPISNQSNTQVPTDGVNVK